MDYAGLLQEIDSGLLQLAEFGVQPDDVVALALPPGPEATVVIFCLLSATCCAPLNPDAHPHEIGRSLVQMRATALVLRCGEDSSARAVAAELGVRIIEIEARPGGRAGELIWRQGFAVSPKTPRRTRGADTVLLLQTSGTTSQPKMVPLTQSNLLATLQNVSFSLELGQSDSTLNIMPLFHMHGLTTELATLLTGGRLVCVPGFSGEKFFRWLEDFTPTWITAAPAIHLAILAHARTDGILDGRHRLRVLRTGSAPISLADIQSLEALFATEVTEFWGMTEASCSTSNRVDLRKQGSVGQPVGTEVAVLDTCGEPLTAGERGEVWLRGPNVMHRYHSPPEANNDVFRGGWLRSGDEGYVDEEGFLFICGRLQEQINRGGEKIAPAEIDEVVLGHQAVAEAVAFGLHHPRLGETVAVAVVLKPGCSASVEEIQEHVAREAALFKVPHHVFFVAALPKTVTGKPQRLLLTQRFTIEAAPDAVAPPDLAHATPLQKELHAIWAEVLGFAGFSLRDNFFYLGGDSLAAFRVLDGIRRRLDRELTLADLFHAPTVNQLAAELTTDLEQADDGQNVVAIRASGSRPPFYLLGGSFAFLDFASRFSPPEQQPFFLIPPAPLEMLPRRPSVAALARDYLAILRARQPHGPYFIGGYCFHGLVAQEMACELVAQGEEVPLLVLVDATPCQPDLRRLIVHGSNLCRACLRRCEPLTDQGLWPWLNRADRLQRWWRAGDEDRLKATLNLIRRRLGLEREPGVKAMPAALPASRLTHVGATYGAELLLRYTLAMATHEMMPFGGRIELFLSEEYRAQTRMKRDRGWRFWAKEVKIHPLRGDHQSCLLVDHEYFGSQLDSSLPAAAVAVQVADSAC